MKALTNPEDYEWSVQGLGMLRAYLTEDRATRLQIWLKELQLASATSIHTHPWDFESIIYRGELINRTYAEVPGHKFDCYVINTGPTARPLSHSKIDLEITQNRKLTEGQSYYQPKEVPHLTLFSQGAISIIHRLDYSKSDGLAKSYGVGPWVSAAPQDVSWREARSLITYAMKQ